MSQKSKSVQKREEAQKASPQDAAEKEDKVQTTDILKRIEAATEKKPMYYTCLNRREIGGGGCSCVHNVVPTKVSTNPDHLDRPCPCDEKGKPLPGEKEARS